MGLWHLAVADIAFGIGSIINATIEFGGVLERPNSAVAGFLTCHAQLALVVSMGSTSTTLELAIVLGFVFVHFRLWRAVVFVNRWLPYTWCLGILIGIVDT